MSVEKFISREKFFQQNIDQNIEEVKMSEATKNSAKKMLFKSYTEEPFELGNN